MRVKNSNDDDFWAVKQDNLCSYKLGVCDEDKTFTGANGTWRDINVVTTSEKRIKFSGGSRFS